MEEQVVDHVLSIATVTEEVTNYKGALTPDPVVEKESEESAD